MTAGGQLWRPGSVHFPIGEGQVSVNVQYGDSLFVPSFFFSVFLLFLWATPMAYGGSQARGPIGAVATVLRQSHSIVGSKPHLQPTPQLTESPDH